MWSFTEWFMNTDTIGIFWDYENVPLRYRDCADFLTGLTNYINTHNVAYFKVYFRTNSPIGQQDLDLMGELPLIQFKEIAKDGPNAADNVLMQSCIDVLRNKEEINHVILLSGDADFLALTNTLQEWNVKITIICQQQNYSDSLVNESQHAYTVGYIAENPNNWWMG